MTRISRAIKPEDSEHHAQIVYYQAGVGTGLGIKDQLLGGGTGLGLSEHIREAYYFLANNYSPGDSIFLVGFSRGSFTARSLGGLIGNLGLLNKRGLPHFYEVFLDWTDAGNTESPGPSFWEHYRDPLEPEKRHILKPHRTTQQKSTSIWMNIVPVSLLMSMAKHGHFSPTEV